MDIEWVRDLCLSFPKVTEEEVWTNDLTFKVAGKMFAHTVLVPAPVWISFKASPEAFADLTERPNIIPAPYLARAKWIALETKDALPSNELALLLRESYDMVVAKLPKKVQESLLKAKPAKSPARKASSKKSAGKKSAPNARKSATKVKKPSR